MTPAASWLLLVIVWLALWGLCAAITRGHHRDRERSSWDAFASGSWRDDR